MNEHDFKHEEPVLKIRRISDTAVIPTRGSKDAAGYDLYCAESSTISTIEIHPGTTVKIHTGIQMEIPDGYVGLLFARSGIAIKKGLRPANAVGVIDSDYRGEIIVALHNDSNTTQCVNLGDRVAQLVLVKYFAPSIKEVIEDLSETERGEGGFGHTGK